MSAPDRRTFLKRAAAVSAAAASGSLLPARALAGTGVDGTSAPVWRPAPCTLCGVGCGLEVGVEGGRAVAVRGDPDAPVSRGLACVKGYHAIQALYGGDRLTRARVRRGGSLVEVPLSEALDRVARALADTVEAHGGAAAAIYGSRRWTLEAEHLARRLFTDALGSDHVATDLDLEDAGAQAGALASVGLPGPLGSLEDLDRADVFVLWDANLAETHPVLFSRLLERRQRSPDVRIVDLATRTTRTSYAADRSLLLAPGSDLAVANAICHEIVERGWVDEGFVEAHVAFRKGATGLGHGLEGDLGPAPAAAEASRREYTRLLDAWGPEAAARLSGLPAADIRWLASLYGDRARRVVSLWDAGTNRHARSTWINNLIHNIHLLVGKVASPGQGPFPLARTSPATGASAAAVGGAVPLFRALERGDVRFLWIQQSDPMVTLPALRRYRAAARAEGRFLVVSDAYPTSTTDVADVVLPAALWLEEEGTVASAGRRIQHVARMLQPPGDATSAAWQLAQVARRMGFDARFPGSEEELVARASREVLEARGAPPLAELRGRPGLEWPVADGREIRWRCNTEHDPAADAAHGRFDFYGHPDHRAWIWIRPHVPQAEPPDEAFPFRLTVGEILEHTGSGTLTRRIPTLHRAVPRAWVEVNAEDARALGVRNGETVRLASRRGSLEIEARVDYRSQPPRGNVFVPFFDEDLPVNELTLDALDPLSGQPAYRCAVRVERRGGRTGP